LTGFPKDVVIPFSGQGIGEERDKPPFQSTRRVGELLGKKKSEETKVDGCQTKVNASSVERTLKRASVSPPRTGKTEVSGGKGHGMFK